MTSQDYQVIIAGAGPAGLFLACELGLAGVSTLVLEKKPTAADPWRDGPVGLRVLNHMSSEIFYRRNLLSKVITRQVRGSELSVKEKDREERRDSPVSENRQADQTQPSDSPFASHFAGIVVHSENVDWSQWRHILPGPSAFGGALQLGQLLQILYERSISLGVKVLYDYPLTRFEDTGSHVKVWAGPNDDTFTTSYLIGADGGRSFVRRNASFTFTGSEATWVGYVADCDMTAESNALLTPGFHRTDKGAYVARPPTYFVLDFDAKDSERRDGSSAPRPEVTPEAFESVIRRVSEHDALSVSQWRLGGSFTDRAKLTTEYRRNRIFLIGDAAHIHAPLGGQGLNLGLADAMNLGWKLASVIKNSTSDTLLDTYHTERHPIALQILETTRVHTEAIRPGLQGEAIYNLFKEIINTRDGSTLITSKFIWFHPRLDLGSKHWLVGLSAPDFDFEDGVRLGRMLEGGKWVVVDFSRNGEVKKYVEGLGEGWTYTDSEARERLGLGIVVVRPDGVVAWARDQSEVGDNDVERLKGVVGRWLK